MQQGVQESTPSTQALSYLDLLHDCCILAVSYLSSVISLLGMSEPCCQFSARWWKLKKTSIKPRRDTGLHSWKFGLSTAMAPADHLSKPMANQKAAKFLASSLSCTAFPSESCCIMFNVTACKHKVAKVSTFNFNGFDMRRSMRGESNCCQVAPAMTKRSPSRQTSSE